jgi:large subunit ribosomal protein L14
MIQPQTLLKVADNSGAKIVKCIKILGKFKKAKIGNIIVVSVKKNKENSNIKLKKKVILKAVVLRTNCSFKQDNGFFVKFKNNSIAFLDNHQNPIGTRIFGLIPRKLKKKFNKLVTISSYLV